MLLFTLYGFGFNRMKIIVYLFALYLLTGCAIKYEKINTIPKNYKGEVAYIIGSNFSDGGIAYTIEVLKVNDYELDRLSMAVTFGNVIEVPAGETDLLIYVMFGSGITGVKRVLLEGTLEPGGYYQVVAEVADFEKEEFIASIIKHDKRSYFKALCDIQTHIRDIQIKYRELPTPACQGKVGT